MIPSQSISASGSRRGTSLSMMWILNCKMIFFIGNFTVAQPVEVLPLIPDFHNTISVLLFLLADVMKVFVIVKLVTAVFMSTISVYDDPVVKFVIVAGVFFNPTLKRVRGYGVLRSLSISCEVVEVMCSCLHVSLDVIVITHKVNIDLNQMSSEVFKFIDDLPVFGVIIIVVVFAISVVTIGDVYLSLKLTNTLIITQHTNTLLPALFGRLAILLVINDAAQVATTATMIMFVAAVSVICVFMTSGLLEIEGRIWRSDLNFQ